MSLEVRSVVTIGRLVTGREHITFRVLANVLFLDLGDIALVLLILFCACCMILVSWLSVEIFSANGWTELNLCSCSYLVYFQYTYLSCFTEVLQNACFSGLAFLARWLCSFLIRVLCSLSIWLSSAWSPSTLFITLFCFCILCYCIDEGRRRDYL